MMPQPGERHPGFVAQVDRCWAFVYSKQLQATHCRQAPTHTGRWFAKSGDPWWRVWSCQAHLEGLTGIRQFGG